MSRRRNQFGCSYLAPFVLWNSLAAQATETMLASAQVVGHRARRMALAGAVPTARDRREFALMAQEKFEAGVRSVQTMSSHALNGNHRIWAEAFGNMLRSASALMLLATSRTPAQWITRQHAVGQELGRSAASLANASMAATRLVHRGLSPIHARATANAKRLGRHP